MINYDAFFSRAAQNSQGSAIRRMGVMAVRVPDMISFAPGYPDPVTFAWDDFREITTELLGSRDGSVLQYGPTRGHPPLIDGLIEMLNERGIRATTEELLITTGSQQGLDLVGRVLLDPGDVVLVELPTYTGAITAFRNTQAAMVGVRQEADGIDLDDLDRVLARERAAGRRVRFLYVVPNFQNPTGLLIGLEKRKRLLEWASRTDMLIVEDDPYGALYFEDAATAADTRPIKADDEEGRVLYLSSFSKTLAPGFRVAWVAAPSPLVAKLEVAKQAEDLLTGGLDQRIVYEAWKRGVLARQVSKLRAFYQHKRTVMEQTLRAELRGLLSWPEPRGGFFLWAALPKRISADAMLPRAVEQKVIYVAGSAFFVDGRGANLMRLSFSLPSPERIAEGVRRLAVVVREAMAGHREPVEI
jgi:2-aminoadipate transaminase